MQYRQLGSSDPRVSEIATLGQVGLDWGLRDDSGASVIVGAEQA